ncbi:hypothetical protein M8C21_006411, partial [Ambrosia artemisiifolia]
MWKDLSDDILRQKRIDSNISDLVLSEDQIKNIALLDIENFLLRNSSRLRHFIDEQKDVYQRIMKAVYQQK